MSQPVPKRNWSKWWYAYAAHVVTGITSGGGIGIAIGVNEPVWALTFLITVTVIARQTVEYLRRNDTPGRDLGDHLIGLFAGLAVALTTHLVAGAVGG